MKASKKRWALLTACVITAVSNCAFAEESELETYDAAEYVVTATKTPLEKKDVPMAVEVIGEEEIKASGAYSVQDALRFSTNIDVSDNGMTGNQVQVRGMDTNKVLILIDGRRMAQENTSSTTNCYELNRINMSDVERIEVIRGNGSALYGSDAMAGVINIIMKKATKPHFNIDLHSGSKESGYNFSYASGREGKLSFKASGGVDKVRERFIDPYVDDGETNSGNNMNGMRRFLNLGFDYALTEKTGLAFDMNFMREKFTSFSATYNPGDPEAAAEYYAKAARYSALYQLYGTYMPYGMLASMYQGYGDNASGSSAYEITTTITAATTP